MTCGCGVGVPQRSRSCWPASMWTARASWTTASGWRRWWTGGRWGRLGRAAGGRWLGRYVRPMSRGGGRGRSASSAQPLPLSLSGAAERGVEGVCGQVRLSVVLARFRTHCSSSRHGRVRTCVTSACGLRGLRARHEGHHLAAAPGRLPPPPPPAASLTALLPTPQPLFCRRVFESFDVEHAGELTASSLQRLLCGRVGVWRADAAAVSGLAGAAAASSQVRCGLPLGEAVGVRVLEAALLCPPGPPCACSLPHCMASLPA